MDMSMWVPFALMVISVVFVIYGALIYKRKWTPLGAKVLVEKEFIEEWCKSEGKTKMLWGICLAFFAMYYAGILIPILWLGIAIALAVYNIYQGYVNNQKYMKN